MTDMHNNISTGRGELVFFLACNAAITASVFVLGYYMFMLVTAVL